MCTREREDKERIGALSVLISVARGLGRERKINCVGEREKESIA